MKKKILSLMLAVVMMLSLSVTALAYTDTNGDEVPDNETSISITKVYEMEGEGDSPEETFYLYQVGNGTVLDGEGTATALVALTGDNLPNVDDGNTVVASVTFSEGAAGDATNGESTFTVSLPTYTKVGIYEYELKEVDNGTPGVSYFEGSIYLVVYVINEVDDDNVPTGNLITSVAVHTEADWTYGTEYDEEDLKSDEITNTYSAGSLEISKTVTGNGGDKSQYFKVTVTLTAEDGFESTDYENLSVTGGSYENNPTTITVGTAADFYLKDGDTIIIENIPYGVTYTVVEYDYTGTDADEGYDAAKYSVNEKTATNTSVSDEELNAEAETVEITNNKETEVDMGVYLDNLPYILMLIVVAAGVVVMISKRRLNDRF